MSTIRFALELVSGQKGNINTFIGQITNSISSKFPGVKLKKVEHPNKPSTWAIEIPEQFSMEQMVRLTTYLKGYYLELGSQCS
jgi:hypothetical protein